MTKGRQSCTRSEIARMAISERKMRNMLGTDKKGSELMNGREEAVQIEGDAADKRPSALGSLAGKNSYRRPLVYT